MEQFKFLLENYLRGCPPSTKNSPAIKNFADKFTKQIENEKPEKRPGEQIGDAIDEIITSTRGDKVPLVEFVAGLCSFAKREANLEIEPRALSAEIIDNPTERRLRIACYLHVSRSREEVIERFFQSERTIRDDLKALREGFTFMGQWIQVEVVREKRKIRYVSTMHPVFLPLNLTEVYALTAGLLASLPQESPMYVMYQYLADSVFNQLSDYGKNIIIGSAKTPEIRIPAAEYQVRRGYRDERTLIERRAGVVAYMLKRFEDCVVTYVKDGENREVRGRIRLHSSDARKITVITEDASIDLDYVNVISITPVKYR